MAFPEAHPYPGEILLMAFSLSDFHHLHRSVSVILCKFWINAGTAFCDQSGCPTLAKRAGISGFHPCRIPLPDRPITILDDPGQLYTQPLLGSASVTYYFPFPTRISTTWSELADDDRAECPIHLNIQLSVQAPFSQSANGRNPEFTMMGKSLSSISKKLEQQNGTDDS